VSPNNPLLRLGLPSGHGCAFLALVVKYRGRFGPGGVFSTRPFKLNCEDLVLPMSRACVISPSGLPHTTLLWLRFKQISLRCQFSRDRIVVDLDLGLLETLIERLQTEPITLQEVQWGDEVDNTAPSACRASSGGGSLRVRVARVHLNQPRFAQRSGATLLLFLAFPSTSYYASTRVE
jgi:hypothetical protein